MSSLKHASWHRDEPPQSRPSTGQDPQKSSGFIKGLFEKAISIESVCTQPQTVRLRMVRTFQGRQNSKPLQWGPRSSTAPTCDDTRLLIRSTVACSARRGGVAEVRFRRRSQDCYPGAGTACRPISKAARRKMAAAAQEGRLVEALSGPDDQRPRREMEVCPALKKTIAGGRRRRRVSAFASLSPK